MRSAADLDGIFIVLVVAALAFTQIVNMRETGPSEKDWIVLSSVEATPNGPSLFVYFQSCFENVHKGRSRDTVDANSGIRAQTRKGYLEYKNYVKY